MNKEIINKLKDLEVLHLLKSMMKWYVELKEANADEIILNAYIRDLHFCQFSIKESLSKGNDKQIIHSCHSSYDHLVSLYSAYMSRNHYKDVVTKERVITDIDKLFKHYDEIQELTKDD